MSTDGKSVFTTAAGSGRPRVERIDVRTGARSTIYESETTIGETIVAPLDDDFNRALITRSSSTVPAQQYILDVKTKQVKQITDNKNHWPEMAGLIRKTIYARRRDNNVNIQVRVTLPADWTPGKRLPALFWFYPSEYDSAEAYNPQGGRGGAAGAAGGGRGGAGGAGAGGAVQTGTVPSYGPRTMAFITQAGYALIEPDSPIIGGNGLLPNDNYIRDLRTNLLTVVDAIHDSGFVDKNRLSIGGHSYGGFSTVNALVHTTLFKAGIAGDGNYNRTLTPNGFQRESRTLWQGRETYLAMSPFLYADNMTGALLLYHSIEDQNVGTDPINSPKLFHALQGLGKTTAMYMYPYEDHGPVARETVLDQWARWIAWLDKYVKNAQ
jgi:dipeptidyl aminopeptidase/acylaminoacyl peptidase